MSGLNLVVGGSKDGVKPTQSVSESEEVSTVGVEGVLEGSENLEGVPESPEVVDHPVFNFADEVEKAKEEGAEEEIDEDVAEDEDFLHVDEPVEPDNSLHLPGIEHHVTDEIRDMFETSPEMYALPDTKFVDDDGTPLSSSVGVSLGGTLYPQNPVFRSMIGSVELCAEGGDGFYVSRSPLSKMQKETDFLPVGKHLFDEGTIRFKGVTLKEALDELVPLESSKESVFWYMMVSAACYLETPRNRYISGESVQTYDKYLCTSSVDVVASWLGLSRDDAETQLKGKLDKAVSPESMEDGLIPWVKLTVDKDGVHKIVKSRNLLDLGTLGMRVTPYVLLDAYLGKILEKAQDEYVRVTYLKDNGEKRVLTITYNLDLLNSVYTNSHSIDMLSMSETPGDPAWKKRIRGYVTVPEVGLPVGDIGTRSLNFNRILSVEYGVGPDLRFVNADLRNVVNTFNDCIEGFDPENVEVLVGALVESGVLDAKEWGHRSAISAFDVTGSMLMLEEILGTELQKKLYLFLTSPVGVTLVPEYEKKTQQTVEKSDANWENSFMVGLSPVGAEGADEGSGNSDGAEAVPGSSDADGGTGAGDTGFNVEEISFDI